MWRLVGVVLYLLFAALMITLGFCNPRMSFIGCRATRPSKQRTMQNGFCGSSELPIPEGAGIREYGAANPVSPCMPRFLRRHDESVFLRNTRTGNKRLFIFAQRVSHDLLSISNYLISILIQVLEDFDIACATCGTTSVLGNPDTKLSKGAGFSSSRRPGPFLCTIWKPSCHQLDQLDLAFASVWLSR